MSSPNQPNPEAQDALEHMTRRRENLLSARTLRLRRLVDLYLNPFFAEFAQPYSVLVELLEEFGKLYLLPVIKQVYPEKVIRVVDWGAGSGWLGYELGHTPVFVDKRPLAKYQGIQELFDVETVSEESENRIAEISMDSDISILSEVLHCLTQEAQDQLVQCINSDELLVIEQVADGTRVSAIAEQQIALASGQPLMTAEEVEELLESGGWVVKDKRRLYHYVIWKAGLLNAR